VLSFLRWVSFGDRFQRALAPEFFSVVMFLSTACVFMV